MSDRLSGEGPMYNVVCLLCEAKSLWSLIALRIKGYSCVDGCDSDHFYLDGVHMEAEKSKQGITDSRSSKQDTVQIDLSKLNHSELIQIIHILTPKDNNV